MATDAKDSAVLEMENLLPQNGKNETQAPGSEPSGCPVTSPSSESIVREQLLMAVRAGDIDGVHKSLYESQLSEDQLKQLVLTFDRQQMTGLHLASERGFADVVKVILGGLSADVVRELVMVKDGGNRTALHLASRSGHVEVIKVFQEEVKDAVLGQLVVEQDAENNTALHMACTQGQSQTVSLLLETMKNDLLVDLIMTRNGNDDTALHLACNADRKEIVKHLLKRLDHHKLMQLQVVKNSEMKTALHKACEHGFTDTVKILLEKLSDDNLSQLMMLRDQNYMTALHITCDNGHTSVVRELLGKLRIEILNELILLQDINGMSALHLACDFGHSCVIGALFQRLSDEVANKFVMIRNNRRMTALHIACELGRSTIVKSFIEKLSEEAMAELIMITDDDRESVLIKACQNGQKDVVKVLFETIKSEVLEKLVMTKDLNNSTALDVAYSYKHFNMITVILEADHHFSTKINKNVIIEACQRGGTTAVLDILHAVHEYTQHHKADHLLYKFLTKQDEDGRMVLHIACDRGDKDVIRGILRYAKQTSILSQILCHADKSNRTPLHESCQQEDNQMVQLLLDAAEKANCVEDMLCNQDKTALFEAFENGDYNNVKTILDQSRICNCTERLLSGTNKHQHTLFHRACLYKFSHLRCLDVVIKAAKKARFGLYSELLNKIDSQKKTFLFYVSEARNDVLNLLISQFNDEESETKEIDIYTFLMHKDDDGKTAIHYAQEAGKADVLTHILAPLHENLSDLKTPKDFALLDDQSIQANYEDNRSKSLLTVVGETECLDLIQDEYITTYLQCCWKSYGCYFFFVNLFLYIVLLVSLTAFVVSHQFHFEYINGTYVHSDVNLVSRLPPLTTTCQYFLVIFAFLTLINELMQMVAKREHYWLTLENKTDLAVCLGSLVMSIGSLITGYNYWQHQLGAATMCFAWINAAWIMTKIPTFNHSNLKTLSLMFVMLFRAIRGVCIFIPIFSIFVLTFSVVFSSLFQSQSSFREVGFSVMKTIAMTIGEVDFNAIFAPEDEKEMPPFYLLSCVLFVVFIGIMTISAMNLLVGMAVGDIVELRTQSEVLAFKTTLDFTLESQASVALYTKIRSKVRKEKHEEKPTPCLEAHV